MANSLLGAVAAYILAYTDTPNDKLFRGYQNRMAKPRLADYTIFNIDGTERVGTNVTSYEQSSDNKLQTRVLRSYSVSIDFCALDQSVAQQRATTIETFSRSNIGVEFFKQYDIAINFAEDVLYIPFMDDTKQYINRYRVNIHLTRWETMTTVQEYAEEVILQRVENIDACYKPLPNE